MEKRANLTLFKLPLNKQTNKKRKSGVRAYNLNKLNKTKKQNKTKQKQKYLYLKHI